MLCLFMAPWLAGCNLVTVNVDKQLNEVVANYDDGYINITREQLILTYNYFGNRQFDNSSSITEEGLDKTLDLALNRALLVDFLTVDPVDATAKAERHAMRKAFGLDENPLALSITQFNEIWQNVYEYTNDAVASVEKDLRKEDNASLPTEANSEESDDYKAYDFYSYDKKYYYNTNDGGLTKAPVETPSDAGVNSIALLTNEELQKSFSEQAAIAYERFRQNYWNYTDSIVLNPSATNTKSYSDKAWTKWIDNLTSAEKDRKLSTASAEVFMRQIQRIYDVYYDNAVLTVLQDNYTNNLTITAQMVYDKYQQEYASQKAMFDLNSSKFDSQVATSAEKLYCMYKPTEYFKVNHVLIKFSDEQTKQMEQLKKDYDNGKILYQQYQTKLAEIKNDTKGYNREDGKYYTLVEIQSQLQSALNSAQNEAQKVQILGDFMHKYTNDDNTINGTSCYYIPLDKSKDQMQEAFADASRDLFDAGNGHVGDISGWTETSYGFHIIMYTGTATDVAPTGQQAVVLSRLNNYLLNPLYNKSMMDNVLELISIDNFASYQNDILNMLKEDKTIIINRNLYSDLYQK